MIKKCLSLDWNEFLLPYLTFSAFTDENDWNDILKCISCNISKSKSNKLNILDYGAGIGTTSYSIRRHLYGTHGRISNWTLMDPDKIALNSHVINMPALGDSMLVSSVNEIHDFGEFNCIIFVHSTYYINNLENIFLKILKSKPDNCIAIFVVMSDSSPFFNKSINNYCIGTYEDIVKLLKKYEVSFSLIKMKSRFRLYSSIENDYEILKNLTSFFYGEIINDSELIYKFSTLISSEFNIVDNIIVVNF